MSHIPDANQPILTITTSKNWVLPPRPKNVRKSKSCSKKKETKQRLLTSHHQPLQTEKLAKVSNDRIEDQRLIPMCPPDSFNQAVTPLLLDSPEQLATSINNINQENYQLKTKLLLLIHDYKSLKSLVTSPTAAKVHSVDKLYDTATTARKRVYPEMGDPMNDLISDMSGLSHASPSSVVSPADDEMDQSGFEMELFNFINLEQASLESIDEDFGPDVRDEDEDDEVDSASLSRLISPSSDSDENSLMTTLTRSTTVSTTNSIGEKKLFAQQFKFYDLPEFSEEDYVFLFEKSPSSDKMLAVIEEDQYNQVADFLAEKLMNNDVQYYVEKNIS